MDVASQVERLPEVYQRVYGHPELDHLASRTCDDRLALIRTVLASCPEPPERTRILEVGCGQGYFCLKLDEAGYTAAGIDALPENIALCQALNDEHGRGVDFACQALTLDSARAIPDGRYQVVLLFSVLHHICHGRSLAEAREIVRILAGKADCLLAELAVADEPVYWADSLPPDPRDILAPFAFVTRVGETATHLSEVARPVFFASNRYALVGDAWYPFTAWRDSPHELERGSHLGSRRYFFSDDCVIKQYRMAPEERAAINRREMQAEADLLAKLADRIAFLPKLRAFEKGDDWLLVQDRKPGERLSACIAAGTSYDPRRVATDIVDELAELERHGLYHHDLATWNVLLGPEGRASLIDFGAVAAERADAVFDAFLTLLYDVVHRALQAFAPFRRSRRSAEIYPPPFRSLVLGITAAPAGELTFAGIHAMLSQEPTEPAEPDRRLDALARNYARLEQAFNDRAEELLEAKAVLARKVARLEQVADALVRENARLRRSLRLLRAKSRFLRRLRRLFGKR